VNLAKKTSDLKIDLLEGLVYLGVVVSDHCEMVESSKEQVTFLDGHCIPALGVS
jgi:hypothetical protein